MASHTYTCTGCVPIDAKIIDVYKQMIGTEARAEQAAEDAEFAAQHAIGKSPYIGENGDWFEWDDDEARFIDTGIQAHGSIAVDTEMSLSSTNPVQNKVVTAAVNDKQDTLVSGTNIKTVNGESLLGSGNIIAGDPNAVKYTEQSLTDGQKTQARANIGAGTYTKAGTGIPAGDLASGVQTSLGKADTAYQKPSGGIPATDLTSAAQTSLGKADTAYQKPGTGIPSTDLASAVQTTLGKADTAYQKPGTGIPKTDLASGVQASLDLADTAIQARPMGEVDPTITPATYATKEELDQLELKVDENDSELKQELGGVLFFQNVGRYIKRDGTIGTSSVGYYTEPIPVKAGETLTYSAEGYGCTILASYNNGTYTPIVSGEGQLTYKDATYTAPADGFVAFSGTPNTLVLRSSIDRTERLNEKVDGITGEQLLTSIEEENKLISAPSGEIADNSYYFSTKPVFVRKGDKVNVYCSQFTDGAVIATSQSADATTFSIKASGIDNNGTLQSYEWTATEDCYVRLCGRVSKPYRYYIYKNGQSFAEINEKIEQLDIDINGQLVKINFDNLTVTRGQLLPNGTLTPDDTVSSRYATIPIEKRQIVTFTSCEFSDTAMMGFCTTENGTYTILANGEHINGNIPKTFQYTAKEDGYIALIWRAAFAKEGTVKTLTDIAKDVEDLKNAVGTPIAGKRYSNCKSFGIQPPADGTSGSFMNTANGYAELISGIYEPLRTAFPSIISRTELGYDASGTIMMYAYDFKPFYYQQTIVLQAGIHAVEPDAIACLARIMQMIYDPEQTDADLLFLRQNCRIIVIPCVNVWGFSQTPKNNKTSADKNLQTWNTDTCVEIENIKAYYATIMDKVSFMIDMHTTTNDTYLDFYGNLQRWAKNVRTIFRTNGWLCENYAKNGATVADQYLGYSDDMNICRYYCYVTYGVESSTLELSDYRWGAISSADAITMGVTMWLNYIIQQANDFYKNEGSQIPDSDYKPGRA